MSGAGSMLLERSGAGVPAAKRSPLPGVLVVDDDADFARMLERLLVSEGYRAVRAGSAEEALQHLAQHRHALQIVLTDIRMPQGSGMELLREVRRRYPELQVVMMTGYGTIEQTVEAMKLGAADFIPKPFDNQELLLHLQQLQRMRRLERELAELRGELGRRQGFEAIVGGSPAVRQLVERAAAAARTDSSVLIVGETGTGKELVARAIHHHGPRAERRFVAINCAALPREIIESELFGHRRGAFTGAHAEHPGLFRAADGGTLLLDELAEMPVETQAKLLRVLEDGCVRPLGSTEEVAVDCRIIAATNADPRQAVASGRLRADLYYRLSVITLEIPPLRARREDVPLLLHHFLDEMNARTGRRIAGFTPRAMQALCRYEWPGNVRELRNLVEGVYAFAECDTIDLELLPERVQAALAGSGAAADLEAGSLQGLPPLDKALAALERRLVLRALELSGGNKSRAAELLRISRKRIYRKLEEYGLLGEQR
ncbi:MAG: acetoacetate metabolism regulatory protein AtoC [Planctomycetota bacterium]|nr:MAG: acetoacetate metabolism regulatory protein AtoC [Planctomycetota bacterium]